VNVKFDKSRPSLDSVFREKLFSFLLSYPDFPLASVSLNPLFAAANPLQATHSCYAVWSLAPATFLPSRGHCQMFVQVTKCKQKHAWTGKGCTAQQHTSGSGGSTISEHSMIQHKAGVSFAGEKVFFCHLVYIPSKYSFPTIL
jgi:hypothetical protein